MDIWNVFRLGEKSMLGTILTVLLILFFMCGIALTAAVTVYVIKEILKSKG